MFHEAQHSTSRVFNASTVMWATVLWMIRRLRSMRLPQLDWVEHPYDLLLLLPGAQSLQEEAAQGQVRRFFNWMHRIWAERQQEEGEKIFAELLAAVQKEMKETGRLHEAQQLAPLLTLVVQRVLRSREFLAPPLSCPTDEQLAHPDTLPEAFAPVLAAAQQETGSTTEADCRKFIEQTNEQLCQCWRLRLWLLRDSSCDRSSPPHIDPSCGPQRHERGTRCDSYGG
jgi:hypothetical protein